MELIDEVLECNRKTIENNEKLIEVNKEWAALAQSLLKLLMEERRKCTNEGKADCTIHMTLRRPEKGEQDG